MTKWERIFQPKKKVKPPIYLSVSRLRELERGKIRK